MKKRFALAAALVLSVSVLSGCSLGKPSVEKLVDGMYENQYDSANAEVEANVDMTVSAMDTSVDITAGVTMDMQMSGMQDEPAYYMSGKVDYSVMGLSNKVKFEMYSLTDGDENTTYVYTDADDMWRYTTVEMEESYFDEDFLQEVQDAGKELWYGAELADKTEEINGVECYVLTLELNGSDLMNVMDLMAEQSEEYADALDMMEDSGVSMEDIMECLQINCTSYVSKKDGYQVGAVVDLADSDMDALLDILADADMEIDEFEINEFNFSVFVSDIDNVTVELPEDVEDEAVEAEQLIYSDLSVGETDVMEEPGDEEDWEDDWDDEEDYEDEEDNASTTVADGEIDFDAYGPVYISSFTLPEYYGIEDLCEVTIPDGFGLYPEYSVENDYYDIISDDGNLDFYVQNYLPYLIQDYVLDDYVEEGYEISVDITDLGITYMGSPVYLMKASLTDDSDYLTEKNYVVFEYSDYYGDTQFAGIEFYSGDENFSNQDYIDLFEAVFQ
ncbi:MAG: hypothetical protein ACI4DU_01765 [Lachnospiraceae bacterium]